MATRPETNALPAARLPTYEESLNRDLRWAMSEGSRFFAGAGGVQQTLRNISRRLDELGIPYAVAGGMALFAHGYRRFTEDVDILVTHEGLQRVHGALDGLGYVRPFEHSKHLRDVETQVKIEFLVAGQFPGDGKPKPVAFPDPAHVAQEIDGVRYVNLPTLIDLKLASGTSNASRVRDLADVGELVRVLRLSEEFAERLDLSVQPAFLQIVRRQRAVPTRFVLLLPLPERERPPRSLDELIAALPDAGPKLQALRARGAQLDAERTVQHGYAYVVTTDPAVAEEFALPEESELDLK